MIKSQHEFTPKVHVRFGCFRTGDNIFSLGTSSTLQGLTTSEKDDETLLLQNEIQKLKVEQTLVVEMTWKPL